MRGLVASVDAVRRRLALRPGKGLVDGATGARWDDAQAEDGLTTLLYERVFIGWRPDRGEATPPAFFQAQLRSRALGATYFEGGFRVVQREAQGAFVRSDAIRLWVTEPDALSPRRARVGLKVKVRLPCAREAAVPGFFTVVSRQGRLTPGAPYIRAYLNVTTEGALGLVDALLTDRFIKGARFEAQVVNDPRAWGRRDTALVFVHPPDWKRVVWWLRAVHRYETGWFREGHPPMTLEVAPGISAAESPASEADIFGAHRCRLLARALLQSLKTKAPWTQLAPAAFEAEGLDFAAPWLGQLGDGWTRT